MKRSIFIVGLFFAGWVNADITGVITQPAGHNGEMQFNKKNSFGADSDLTYSTTSKTLSSIQLTVSTVVVSQSSSFTGISTMTIGLTTMTFQPGTALVLQQVTPGNCLETNANGTVIDAGAVCGSGGGGVTPGSTNYIQNRATLQSSATAYPAFLQVGSSATIYGDAVINGILNVNPYGSVNGKHSLKFDPSGGGYFYINNETGGGPTGGVILATLGTNQAFAGMDGSTSYVIQVGTAASGVSTVDRISIQNYNSTSAKINFNPSNHGFRLDESSMTFLSATGNPVFDWNTANQLRLTNSTFSVTAIRFADGTVQISSPAATDTSTFLTQSSATANYLTLSSATGTYFNKSSIYVSSVTGNNAITISGTNNVAGAAPIFSANSSSVTLLGQNPPAANIAAGVLGSGVIASSASAIMLVSSFPATGVTAASYTNTNLTVDAYGRITTASNGSAGSGGYAVEPATITFQLNKGFSASTGTFTSSVTIQGALSVGTTTAIGNLKAQVHIVTPGNRIGLIVQDPGAPPDPGTGTSDLAEFWSDTGAVLSSVTAAGAFITQSTVDANIFIERSQSPGIAKIVAVSSQITSGLVSLSTDVSGCLPSINVSLQKLGTPLYSTLQDLANFSLSPGQSDGGLITQGTGSTVNISSGTGFIKALDSNTATNYFMTWASSTGVSVPLGSTRYIGINYNSGTPIVSTKSADSWDLDTEFPLGVVVNELGVLYISTLPWVAGDNNANIIERFDSLALVSRDNRQGGLILSNTGTRNVAVTAGQLLARMSEFPITAIDTSVSKTFDNYYRNGSGGWTIQKSSTAWNNTQYDDNSGTLATLTALNYTSRWFYLMTDGSLAMVYGQAQYATLAAALNDGAPSSVSDRILKQGLLIGRFIIQASGSIPAITQSAFGTSFTAASVTNFSDLAGTADISSQTNLAATSPIVLTNDTLSLAQSTYSISITIDGGGLAIVAGSTRAVTIPYACTISSWSVLADVSGSISVHISSSTFGNYPTLSNMSGAGNSPSLTSAQKNSAAPSGWTGTTLGVGSVVAAVVDTASTVTWVNVVLWVVK